MIKFFRHIRKALLAENKFSKYLIYAMGEIILVVVGILIALQVNNLNQKSQLRDLEKKILEELLVDLSIAKADIENDIRVNKRWLKRTELLKSHLHNKKAYHDSIEEFMSEAAAMTQFSPRTSGYQNLKSEGVSLIRNDSLRKEISNLFEITFPSAVIEGREYSKNNNSEIDLALYFDKHFEIDMNDTITINYRNNSYKLKTNPPIIKDYKALLKDKTYIKMLQKTIYDRSRKISVYILTKRKVDLINKMIKEELKEW